MKGGKEIWSIRRMVKMLKHIYIMVSYKKKRELNLKIQIKMKFINN